MAIDYRKEVDSGYDRKRIIEHSIIEFLKCGIPVSIIEQHPNFIFGHDEMLNNLKRGYESKKNQILEIYGGYGKELDETIVPNIYSEVSHPVGGELYPMTPEETIEKFKQRDGYILEIQKLMNKQSKNIEKEKEKIINKIVNFKAKYPIIDRILQVSSEMDNIKESNTGKLVDYVELFKKNGLVLSNLQEYEKIYETYNKLQEELNEVTRRYEKSLNNKTNSDEIKSLVFKKELLEKEIIQRNTKLVNGFLRQKYSDLLVEADDLFQVCYIELGNAVKDFDYKKGNRFSSLAYKYMDIAVKSNFKVLTGEKWENYWYYKMIRCVSDVYLSITGRKATVGELAEHFNIPISKMREDLNLCYGTFSFASIIPEDDDEEYLDENSDYEFKDDEGIIEDSESLSEQILIENNKFNLDNVILREKLKEMLGSLTPREAIIIILRYGLDDGIPKTLKECAEIVGSVSPTRVSQIELKALSKLRHPSRAKELKAFLESETDDYNKRII